jgi:enolase-phosphatase E1
MTPTPTTPSPVEVLLLDIEGTTTSVSFVYDVLFPFAQAELERAFLGAGLLVERWQDPDVAQAVGHMAGGAGRHSPVAAAAAALALMHADVKDTGLKALQGLIWEAGYAAGALRGHVYPDVPAALQRAAEAGVRVAIYSSGSIKAQRLIFGCSEAGDLARFISAWFDTTTGPKKEARSYGAIAEALAVRREAILFSTDNLDEARAAREAGLSVRVAVRPGNAPLPVGHGFESFSSLLELPLPRS